MSLYREHEAARARLAEMQQKELEKREERLKSMSVNSEVPERILQEELARALSRREAVAVVQKGGEVRYEIGPGHIASGQVFYVRHPRLTRRELWYSDESEKVVLTASVDGVFKGEEDNVTWGGLLGSTLQLDNVLANRRLVFPGGFLNFPGNPEKARVEELAGKKWRTVATARQKTPEYQMLLQDFMTLWSQRSQFRLTKLGS